MYTRRGIFEFFMLRMGAVKYAYLTPASQPPSPPPPYAYIARPRNDRAPGSVPRGTAQQYYVRQCICYKIAMKYAIYGA